MPAQTINGKAFEYALLSEFCNRLSVFTRVSILETDAYKTAKISAPHSLFVNHLSLDV